MGEKKKLKKFLIRDKDENLEPTSEWREIEGINEEDAIRRDYATRNPDYALYRKFPRLLEELEVTKITENGTK